MAKALNNTGRGLQPPPWVPPPPQESLYPLEIQVVLGEATENRAVTT